MEERDSLRLELADLRIKAEQVADLQGKKEQWKQTERDLVLLREEFATLQERNDDLMSRWMNTLSQKNEVEESLARAKVGGESLRKEADDCVQRERAQSSTLSDLQEKLHAAEQRYETLESAQSEILEESSGLREHIARLERHVEDCDSEHQQSAKDKDGEMESIRKENEWLRQQCDRSKGFEAELISLREQVDRLQNLTRDQKKSIGDLSEENRQLQSSTLSTLEVLRTEKEKAEQQLEEISTLRESETAEWESSLTASRERLESLEKLNSQLDAKLKEAEEKQRKAATNSEKEIEQLKQKVAASSTLQSSVSTKCASLEVSLREKAGSAENLIRELQTLKDDADAQKAAMQKDVSELTERNTDLSNRNIDLKTELESERAIHEEMKEKVDEMEALQSTVSELSRRLEDMTGKSASQSAELEERRQETLSAATLREECDRLKLQLKTLTIERDDIQRKTSTEIRNLRADLESTRQRVAEYEHAEHEREDITTRLEQELEDLKSSMTASEKTDREMEQVRESISGLATKNSMLQKHCAQLEEELMESRQTHEVESLTEELETVRRDLSRRAKAEDELTYEVQQRRVSMDKMEKTIAEKTSLLEKLQTQNAETRKLLSEEKKASAQLLSAKKHAEGSTERSDRDLKDLKLRCSESQKQIVYLQSEVDFHKRQLAVKAATMKTPRRGETPAKEKSEKEKLLEDELRKKDLQLIQAEQDVARLKATTKQMKKEMEADSKTKDRGTESPELSARSATTSSSASKADGGAAAP